MSECENLAQIEGQLSEKLLKDFPNSPKLLTVLWSKDDFELKLRNDRKLKKLFMDMSEEEVISEDCETPLHSPLTQHVSQAAGSTSLIVYYKATKTAEIESAKNKSSSCEQFQLFFSEHQSRMARAESSFEKIKKQSDRRKRKLVNEFNDSVVSVCSFLKLMSRQNKNLRQSLLRCLKN